MWGRAAFAVAQVRGDAGRVKAAFVKYWRKWLALIR
jgi:hypothetical protein